MKIFKRSRMVTVGIVAAGLALLFTGGSADAAQTGKFGTTVTRVSVLSEDTATVNTGAAWVTLGSSGVYAPAGAFVLATFTAESACYGGSGWCSARILIDGVEADPVVGTDFAFDSTDGNRETAASWESHSMQRSRTVTTSAFHSVVIQVTEIGAGVAARYDDWTLSSMAVQL